MAVTSKVRARAQVRAVVRRARVASRVTALPAVAFHSGITIAKCPIRILMHMHDACPMELY